STDRSAISSSFPEIAPGVCEATLRLSYVACADASVASSDAKEYCNDASFASACSRSPSATWTFDSASAICAFISGALNSINKSPSLTALPRSTSTRSTYPATLERRATFRNGWISPGRVMVRDTGLETTAAISVPCPQASRANEAATIVLHMNFLLPIIVMTPSIHRIQRKRADRSLPLKNRVNRRQHRQGRECGNNQTADDCTAERRGLRSALGETNRHRYHAEDHRRGRHQ